MYKFNSFTQKANEVLNLAIKSAENYGHNYIGSEHILAGLLKEGTGMAAVALSNKGITFDDVDELIKKADAKITPYSKELLDSLITDIDNETLQSLFYRGYTKCHLLNSDDLVNTKSPNHI